MVVDPVMLASSGRRCSTMRGARSSCGGSCRGPPCSRPTCPRRARSPAGDGAGGGGGRWRSRRRAALLLAVAALGPRAVVLTGGHRARPRRPARGAPARPTRWWRSRGERDGGRRRPRLRLHALGGARRGSSRRRRPVLAAAARARELAGRAIARRARARRRRRPGGRAWSRARERQPHVRPLSRDRATVPPLAGSARRPAREL